MSSLAHFSFLIFTTSCAQTYALAICVWAANQKNCGQFPWGVGIGTCWKSCLRRNFSIVIYGISLILKWNQFSERVSEENSRKSSRKFNQFIKIILKLMSGINEAKNFQLLWSMRVLKDFPKIADFQRLKIEIYWFCSIQWMF